MAIKDFIEDEIKNNRVVLFMKGSRVFPQCGFSGRVVSILDTLNTDFVTHDVLQSDDMRQGIKEFSDWPTIPQLYVDGEFVGGCDIVCELAESGELEKMLKT
ncbi:MAG: Glutaredoxin-4 [Chlamydiae bacterium]|nr:Glutaredoxin-4 [Chlamydiota bacterium]